MDSSEKSAIYVVGLIVVVLCFGLLMSTVRTLGMEYLRCAIPEESRTFLPPAD